MIVTTKSDHSSSSNTDLPPDACWEIFVLLPAKCLVRSRAVCKAWRSVIDDPLFKRAHFNKQRRSCTIRFRTPTGPPIYSVDFDALSQLNSSSSNTTMRIPATPSAADLTPYPAMDLPVATCHGLVFGDWEIRNPLFGRHHRLELPRFTLSPNNYNVVRGLGYDYATDDYKAVIIDCGTNPGVGKPTYVHSLRSDSWRRITDCPCGDEYDCLQGLEGPGVYLRGALHWMSTDDDKEFIALDLETESFRKLPLPPFWESELEVMAAQMHLDVLDGRLVVTDYSKDDYENVNFDAWVLKRRRGWVKLFSLGSYGCDELHWGLRPVAYMRNKRDILMQDGGNLYLVDAKTETMKRVTIHDGLTGEFQNFVSAQLFPQSLFRP